MEEIVKTFGIDPVLIAAHIVNFLIIFYILKRYLYKPVLNILKKRQDAIEEGIKQAEEARLLLEKTAEKEKEILRKAREEAQKFLEEAKKQREAFLVEASARARAKEQYILDEAKKQISLEINQAEDVLYKRVVDLSLELFRKSKTALFNEEDQDFVMKHALQELKKAKVTSL